MSSKSPLTATRIIDRNGRATTVHRRNEPAAKTSSSIPLPKMAKAPKSYVPTDAQLKPKQFRAWFNRAVLEPKLVDLAGLMPGVPCVFEANDVEFYSVQSVVGNDEAIILMQCGVRSAEDAKHLLKRERLQHLITDHSALSDKALRQKVSAIDFCEFVSGRVINGVNEDDVIDAVKISTLKGYKLANSFRQLDNLVFEGKIAASDLRAIGPQHLRVKRGAQEIVDALARIKTGKARYDAHELRKLLDWIKNDDSNDSFEYDNGISVADRIGIAATMSLRSKNKTWRVLRNLNGRVASSEEEAFITHADRSGALLVGRGIGGNLTEGAIALYRSGVDPDVARKQLEEGRDVESIISGHLNVHQTVVGGWL